MTQHDLPAEVSVETAPIDDEAPHETSMVVWDAPAPAIVGRPITLRVGVQCSCGCGLADQPVTLRDEDGAVVATGRLAAEPVAGTTALFSCLMTLPAPEKTGVRFLTAACSLEGLEPPHPPAGAAFSYRIDPRPEHEVRVRVVRAADGEPAAGVEVRMDHYEAYTDAEGLAHFALPSGAYSCTIRKLGLKAEPVAVAVPAQVLIEVTAGKGETREELETRLSRWEDQPWA